MSLEEWVRYGITNKYLILVSNKLKITNNLIRDYANTIDVTSSDRNPNLPVRQQQSVTTTTTTGNIEDLYHQFIIDADVPGRISNGRGGWYNGNRFSVRGANAFGKLLKSGINYQALVLSTRLYYEVNKECAVTITNFMVDGGWRTNYYEVLKRAENNELEDHVKHELGQFGRDL